VKIYVHTKNVVSRSKLQKLEHEGIDRQTDSEKDRRDQTQYNAAFAAECTQKNTTNMTSMTM